MYIYLVSQSEVTGYDTYDSFVVVAKSEEEAAQTHPSGSDRWKNTIYPVWASSPANVVVRQIGKAAKGVEKGIVCASFTAG